MRRISTISLTLLFIAACHNGQSANGGHEGPPMPGPSMHEGPPMLERKQVGWTPLQLTPAENDGLKSAIESTPSSTSSGTSHIHADVQNGALVFSADKEQVPSHVSGTESEIMFGGGTSQAIKVVATPGATKLLEEKAPVTAH